MNNLISVIIPCKNGANYIKEALDGIKAQNMNVEVIVVDDGSTDNTSEIAKEYGCKVIRNEESQGPVKAKNAALKIASGDFILFHDHDDIMTQGSLQRLYDEFEPEYSAVQAKVKDFLSPDCEDKNTIVKPEAYYGLFTGAILIRKEVFDIIGGFDESVTAGEIIDWQGKMDKNNLKIKKIDFISTNRRLHSTNFGKTQQKTEFKDYAALLRQKLRNGGGGGGGNLAAQTVAMFRYSGFYNARKLISDEEHSKNVEKLLANLGEIEQEHALNLINKLEKTYQNRMVTVKDIYSANELEQLEKVKQFEKEPQKCEQGYKWHDYVLPLKLFESSVFYYKHGLDRIKSKEKLNNKVIIDAGAFIADSALIFRDEFANSPIYCFEPLRSNYELALKTVELNNIQNITIENYGLGDKKESQKIKTYDTDFKNIESAICPQGNTDIKMTTVDDYVKEHNLQVGLIKTDVEGFEQNLLLGAKNTIVKQKPILLISIYHNYNDFYKIKPMIESWNSGYKFDFFQGVQNSGDITVETLLIAQ